MSYRFFTFREIDSIGFRTAITTREWGSINPFTSYKALERLSDGLSLPQDELASSIVFSEQVNGVAVHTCVRADGGAIRLGVDGLVTDVPGLMLCVYSADCVPIVFASRSPLAYGSLHAGWRGLVGNSINNIVTHFVGVGVAQSSLLVGLGPSICSCCYEIQDDLVELLTEKGLQEFVERSGDRKTLNLRGLARQKLREAGIPDEHIEIADFCTACQSDLFFSARRRGIDEERGSSFASLIWTDHRAG